MELLLVGLNHKSASVEVREKVYFARDDVGKTLPELVQQFLQEGVMISTCNRTELYGIPRNEEAPAEKIIEFLIEKKSAAQIIKPSHFFTLHDYEAARHLFEVASGIDSMLVGDVQILGQVKDAYETATACGVVGTILHQLFNKALKAGKKVKTDTGIGEGAVSVSYAAVEFAEKIFADLVTKKALLIGAGETAELTAKHLAGRGVTDLTIANRTLEKAEQLAKNFAGTAVGLDAIAEKLLEVDILVSSIGVSEYVLTREQIQSAMDHRVARPLLILDIGIPRNIDPAAREIENVFLEDMDSLAGVAKTNYEKRVSEIPKVQEIIDRELKALMDYYDSLYITPTIKLLREQFDNIRQTELERYKNKFSSEDFQKVDTITRTIMNRMLHTPTMNIRQINGKAEFESTKMVQFVKYLFGLE